MPVALLVAILKGSKARIRWPWFILLFCLAAGPRLFYLPPYSPDFNPIEPMWSKIKQILRRHAPRNDERLLQAAKIAFQPISTADCKGVFFSAKYAT